MTADDVKSMTPAQVQAMIKRAQTDPAYLASLPPGTMPGAGVQPGAPGAAPPPGYAQPANVNGSSASAYAPLPGQFSASGDLQVQNELQPNLSDAEALAKQQLDFGLGANDNTETLDAKSRADATGAKYGGAFDAQAGAAGAASNAANTRGTSMYGGDTSAYASAQAYANRDRGMQTDAYGRLMDFASQGPGPSAAQAQLTQSTNAATSNALALARSGRGMGGSAAGMREAIAQNAVTQQTANAQSAELRANENTAFQAQRLGAIGQAGGVASQVVSGDQGTAASGLAGAQYQTDTSLKGTALNDQSAQAWAAQQQAATNAGLGADVGAQTQDLNLDATALAGRESQYASMNQTHGIDSGNATQAGIADANRQQAYVGAGLSAGGAVLASDERVKTNIQPLGGSTVQPLGSQAPAAPAIDVGGLSRNDQDAAAAARNSATGGTVGQIGGAAIGTAVAPGIGTAIGSLAGKAIGGAIGSLVKSDVRSKTDIVPLSSVFGRGLGAAGASLRGQPAPAYRNPRPNYPPTDGRAAPAESPYAPISRASQTAGRGAAWKRVADIGAEAAGQKPDAMDEADPFHALVAKYGNAPVATSTKAVDDYTRLSPKDFASRFGTGNSMTDQPARAAPPLTDRAYGAFARGDHPILSEGDSLLADSARNTPGSLYEYKDKSDGPGQYVGPMAQDALADPLARTAVVKEPSGKLGLDTGRLSTLNTATNHAQQNQIDALDAKLSELKGLLGGSSPYVDPSSPNTDELDAVRRRYPQQGAY